MKRIQIASQRDWDALPDSFGEPTEIDCSGLTETVRITRTIKNCFYSSYDSSAPTMVSYGSSAPRMVSYDSSAPRMVSHDSSAPRMESYDSSAPRMESYDSSAPRMVSHDISAPRMVSYGSSAPRMESYDSSAPTMVSYDSSAPTMESYGSSAPTMESHGSSAPRMVSYGSSAPRMVSYGSSAPRMESHDSSAPRMVSYDSSAPRMVSHDSSAPRMESHDSSAPRMESYDSSAPRMESYGSSAPTMESYGSSAPTMESYGSSAPRILSGKPPTSFKVYDYSVLIDKLNLKLAHKDKTAVHQKVKPIKTRSAGQWLDRENCFAQKGAVLLYKKVSKDLKTQEGTSFETHWTIGETLTVADWRPTADECGPGKFHACSAPRFCDEFRNSPGDRYIAIQVEDPAKNLYAWPEPRYPHKIAVRKAKVLYECDRAGRKIA